MFTFGKEQEIQDDAKIYSAEQDRLAYERVSAHLRSAHKEIHLPPIQEQYG